MDWSDQNVGCDPCEYMDVCAPLHVSTDPSEVVDTGMEEVDTGKPDTGKPDILTVCSGLFQARAEHMSSEVRTATYTVTQALRGGAFGPGSYRALQGIMCHQKQSNGLCAKNTRVLVGRRQGDVCPHCHIQQWTRRSVGRVSRLQAHRPLPVGFVFQSWRILSC